MLVTVTHTLVVLIIVAIYIQSILHTTNTLYTIKILCIIICCVRFTQGCSMNDSNLMDCIRNSNVLPLIMTPGLPDPATVGGPVLDGDFLPTDMDDNFVKYLNPQVDVLTGIDVHDGYGLRLQYFNNPDIMSAAFTYENFLQQLQKFLTRMFGQEGQNMMSKFLSFYGIAKPPSSDLELNRVRLAAIQIICDIIIISPSYRAAELYAGECTANAIIHTIIK